MSADLLREAAADIRAKAEAATPGPWTACPADQPYDDGEPGMFPHGWVGHTDDGRLYSFVAEPVQTEDGPATAEHIASWHPAVALAVADWLDDAAETDECARRFGGRGLAPSDPALAVARAYLGRADA